MNEQLNNVLVGMADAGCTQGNIEAAEKLIEAKQFDKLIKHLKCCRCALMDKLHKSQLQVDRMDFIIRQAEKIDTK